MRIALMLLVMAAGCGTGAGGVSRASVPAAPYRRRRQAICPPAFIPNRPASNRTHRDLDRQPGDARDGRAVAAFNEKVRAYNKTTQTYNACVQDLCRPGPARYPGNPRRHRRRQLAALDAHVDFAGPHGPHALYDGSDSGLPRPLPIFPTRRASGAADCLCLGHQLCRGALGPGHAAAADDGGHPLRAGAVSPPSSFLKKPDVSWRILVLYGFCLGTGQFGMLYLAMDGFISPGMASVVMQMQVFFTIAIAAQRTGEKPKLHQMLGLVPAAVGLILILAHNGEDITPAGLALVLAGRRAGASATRRRGGRASGRRARLSDEPAGLRGMGQPVRHAGTVDHVAAAGRSGTGFPGDCPVELDDLADPGVAERGQYPVRIFDVGLAAVALSGGDGCPPCRCWCRCSAWELRP